MVIAPAIGAGAAALGTAILPVLITVVVVVVVVVAIVKFVSWLLEPTETVIVGPLEEVGPATEFSPLNNEETEARLRKTAPPVVAPELEPPPEPDPKPKKEGNVGPIIHVGKEEDKDECAEQRKNYPVHPYKYASTVASPLDSHHVIQNAHFWQDEAPVETICKGYKQGNALCIPLQGPSGDRNTPHGIVTKMQNADGTAARASGKPMTFGDAIANSKAQLRAAGISEKDVACIMVEVVGYFKATCEGISDDTIIRTPRKNFEE
ncbi:hypothetical protein [Massilia sp. CCM 8734]|uniref:hypothetical protein n=1 Tax=Massilia sp. CCM 8734 TaxID=2609283 RepID=UPI0014246B98|nr:hypothetical protein [Massilia sp. CCM 8734]NIA00555.1 hypothetical protein [Massilia sp. CCM 8734]